MSYNQDQFLKHTYNYFSVKKVDTRYCVEVVRPLIFDLSQDNSSPYVININKKRVGVLLLGYNYGEYDNIIWLDYIRIDKSSRNIGIATSVMNKITEIADTYSITIYLSSAPIENNTNNISSNKLKKWYQKFGFIQYGTADTTLMKREPNIQ